MSAISDSVEDLVANIDGKYPRPHEVEDLWQLIQINKVPDKWTRLAFPTARTSLADFLVELSLRLDFWNKVASKENILLMESFWLPAFYAPKSFLHCLAQTRSRNELIPIDNLEHRYDVQPYYESTKPCREPHSVYLTGFWLEGAGWDQKSQLLVETTQQTRFVQFPVVKLSTPLRESGRCSTTTSHAENTGVRRRSSSRSFGGQSPGGLDSPGKLNRKAGLSLGKLLGS